MDARERALLRALVERMPRAGAKAHGMPTLGSHSPQLDRARALRTKEGRLAQRAFAVEGAVLLAEAQAAGWQPEAVYVTQAALERLVGGVPGVPSERLFVVPARAMERLSDVEAPPGLLAVFRMRLRPLDGMLAAGEATLLLAGVADPGNAGTLLRTAEIFGVRRAIFGTGGVEPHNPKVVRATMGAIFRADVAVAEPAQVVATARRHGYTLVAAARDGTPLPAFSFPSKPLIAIGNERRGVASWLPESDVRVAIPQRGQGESLNAAVAGGIVLYAFAQQFSHARQPG